MQKILITICSFLIISTTSLLAQKTHVTKKAIFIILDGISSDALENIHTPILDKISALGGYTRAYVGGDKGTPKLRRSLQWDIIVY